MARKDDIIAKLRLSDEVLASKTRKKLIDQYTELIEQQLRRKQMVMVNDFMPDELRQFNGPSQDYDESAQWYKGQILIVYKWDDAPATSYMESSQGIRVTEDQAMEFK